eukprot:4010762-Amphidinium_carterae.1
MFNQMIPNRWLQRQPPTRKGFRCQEWGKLIVDKPFDARALKPGSEKTLEITPQLKAQERDVLRREAPHQVTLNICSML